MNILYICCLLNFVFPLNKTCASIDASIHTPVSASAPAPVVFVANLPISAPESVPVTVPVPSDTISEEGLIYPLFIRPQISGNFAELRRGHFHGGVDFRTQQRTGLRVRAVSDGVICKISSSETSYGKALYIRHKDGKLSLYAHLKRFGLGLEKLLRAKRKELKTKEISMSDLHIPISKGEVIAKSGNTGYSAGPHLHFELRSSDQDTAYQINPFLFNLKVKDNTPPILHQLAVFPMDTNSTVNYTNKALYLNLDQLNDTCFISGKISFGIAALDSIEKMPFHYGLYSLLFAVNSDTLAFYTLDSIPMSLCAEINFHVDTAHYNRSGFKIEKTYVDPTRLYTPYTIIDNKGCLEVLPGNIYTLRVEASDFEGNKTSASLVLKATE